MELKNSKTEKNIKNALSGESLARNKYTFYAMQAKQEGHPEIAELFDKMAQNETMHAKIWFQYLHDGLGDTKSNLQDAAIGEYSEWSSMYPDFAKTAREEGFNEIADMFERVADIEKDHEQRFLKTFIAGFGSSTDSNGAEAAGAGSARAEAAAEAAQKSTVPGYRCMFCGAVYEKRPDVCSVCHAIGSFESCTIEK